MDYDFYLKKFRSSADQLNKKLFVKKQLEVETGIVLNSVFLKLYKKRWTNDLENPLNAEARIFFSIWINDKTIKEKKIFYNIHAFKLRRLKDYSIASREFADKFRIRFKSHQHKWENVSVKFGPLTLMEGWKEFNIGNLESTIVRLSNNFLSIDYLIDEILIDFKSK